VRRIIYSTVYNFLIRNFFNVRVHDVNFSFKIIKREVLQNVELTAKSVFIDGELLAEAVRHGFIVKDSPIHYKPRQIGASSFDSVKAATDTFKEIVAYYIKCRKADLKALVSKLRHNSEDSTTQDELPRRRAGK
jgi:hypothetical protein